MTPFSVLGSVSPGQQFRNWLAGTSTPVSDSTPASWLAATGEAETTMRLVATSPNPAIASVNKSLRFMAIIIRILKKCFQKVA